MAEIVTTSIKSLSLVYRGKVRDSYAVGDDKLLIVASDGNKATKVQGVKKKKPERLTQAYDETFFCYEAGFTKILEATALKKLLSA